MKSRIAAVVAALITAALGVVAAAPGLVGIRTDPSVEATLLISAVSSNTTAVTASTTTANLLETRARAFGVNDPEASVNNRDATDGGDTIDLSLPETHDLTLVDDLARPGRLRFFTTQANLVGYQSPPGKPSTANPPNGQPDLRRLLEVVGQSAARNDAQAGGGFYLLRKGASAPYVSGPAPNAQVLLDTLGSTRLAGTVGADYGRAPDAFEIVQVRPGFAIYSFVDDAARCGAGGRCVAFHALAEPTRDLISAATLAFGQEDEPQIDLQFTGAGRAAFRSISKEVVHGAAAEARPGTGSDRFWTFTIAVDDVIQSQPYIDFDDNPDGIDSDRALIPGISDPAFTRLAGILDSGPLPATLTVTKASVRAATSGATGMRITGAIGAVLGALGLILGFVRRGRRGGAPREPHVPGLPDTR